MPVPSTPSPHWNRDAFNVLKAGWSPARRAADEKTLKAMHAMASESLLLSQELAWAKEHDVVIFIDRSFDSKAVSGYYVPGTGVIGIPERVTHDISLMITTLAHEIRHAWQDYKGFTHTPSLDNFAGDYIAQAVLEADAEAYGECARRQYEATQRAWRSGTPAAEAPASLGPALAANFLAWFRTPGDTRHYGDALVGQYETAAVFNKSAARDKKSKGHRLGDSEFSLRLALAPSKLDIRTAEGLLPLGESFSGAGNYLSLLPPAVLADKILNPAQAETFWGTATPEEKSHIAALKHAGPAL